jgi:nucleotide-binding universal stress UspA family protein
MSVTEVDKRTFYSSRMDMILVALDHSSTSQSAARMAIQIARSQRMMVYGLFVVDSELIKNPFSDYETEIDHHQENLSRSNLIIKLEEMGNHAVHEFETTCRKMDVSVITEVVYGDISETIQLKADPSVLLAIGRRGNGHREDNHFLGQNFRKVCHTVRKPILVGGEEKPVIRQILIAAPNDEEANRSNNYVLLFKSSDINGKVIRIIGKSSVEIIKEAIENKADLVMLAGYPPKNPLRWLVGSFTEQVIRNIQAPVLIL